MVSTPPQTPYKCPQPLKRIFHPNSKILQMTSQLRLWWVDRFHRTNCMASFNIVTRPGKLCFLVVFHVEIAS